MNKAVLTLILFCAHLSTFAATEGGHHGHLSDLVAPMVNFLILLSFFMWKIRPHLSRKCSEWSTSTAKRYDQAKSSFKESEIKLKELEDKLQQGESEKRKVMHEARLESQRWAAHYRRELEDRILNINEDVRNRADIERDSLIHDLYTNAIDEVVAKTKNQVLKDSGDKGKISQNLLKTVEARA